MSIISISRGSFSRGREVAERVAAELGYECLARDALLAASDTYNVEELKLASALEDPPSVLERITGGKQRYMVFIRAVLLRHLLADDIVYYGLVGHFFLQQVGHALKVRVITDLEDRVALLRAREEISEAEASRTIAVGDKGRRLWGQRLYGLDPEDPGLYDLVVHAGRVGVEGATETICNLVRQPTFKTTLASRAVLLDLALEAEIEALIIDMPVRVESQVSSSDGDVSVRLAPPRRIHAGSYSGFGAQYLADVEHQLRAAAMELEGLVSLDVVLED